MRKYYIGDDDGNEDFGINKPPTTLEELKHRVSSMTILASVEVRGSRVLVRVQENAGTTQFLSSGMEDKFWLNQFCINKKESGVATFYYFKFPRGAEGGNVSN
jgi:hypothetical protein